jgi:hypothetical protein
MIRFPTEFTRVLAVDIASRGLGFALLEGPLALIDWGFHNARKERDARCITYLVWMLTKFKPDVLVIEDFGQKNVCVRGTTGLTKAAAWTIAAPPPKPWV